MRRAPNWLAVVTGSAIVLLVGAVALSSAQTIFVEVGSVKTSFSASIKPRVLPRSKRGPIAVRFSSQVQGIGGGHIPAMARAKVGVDRGLTVDARGIAACSPGQLENQTSESAEAACATALVGSGSSAIEIALGDAPPITAESRLLVFNGGVAGRTTTILVHAYISTPVIQAIVVPITFTKLAEGGYGMRAQATIPEIAGGNGSLARFDLTLLRQVPTIAGGKHGFLLARCTDGNLVFEPEVEFENGNLARGLLALGCDTQR